MSAFMLIGMWVSLLFGYASHEMIQEIQHPKLVSVMLNVESENVCVEESLS